MFRYFLSAIRCLLVVTALVCAAQCVAEEPNNVGALFDSEEPEESRINEISVALSIEAQIDDLHSKELSRITRLLKHPTLDVQQAELECKKLLAHQYTEESEVLLAAVYIEKGDTATALQCLTNVIERDNSHWMALGARLNLLEALGEYEAASRDASTMMGMASDDSFIGWANPPFYEFSEMLVAYGIAPLHGTQILSGLVGLFVVGCFLLCIRWGLRQKREANGNWRLLLSVSAFVTCLWTIPVAIAATMIWMDVGYPPGLFWWVFVGLFTFFVVRGTMNPPNLTYVGKEALPECDSPEMIARIDGLAKRIGVATPTVRTQRAVEQARDSAAAFVGGLAPHSIVLYDTILSQLREDEQDGVIGHELGHIANRSIWVYTTVFPLTMAAIVVLSFLGGGYFGVMAGFAVRTGSFRLLSRWFEYDCDRRAALATSPDAVARGLRRIYAKHVLGRSGLLTALVHSTSTHPSLDERVHALATLAETGEAGERQSVTVPYDPGRVALCRKLVVVFSILWACLVAYGISSILWTGDSTPPLFAIFMATFGPSFFVMLAARRPLRIAKARMKGRFRWSNLTLRKKIGTVSLSGIGLILATAALLPDDVIPIEDRAFVLMPFLTGVAMMICGVGILFGFSGNDGNQQSRKKPKLAQSITAAIQRNDFEGVIEICKDNYDVVKKDRQLRYSGAAALLATRQLEKFVPYCEQIREDFPHYPPPAIALATVYLDQGEPEKALDAICGIENDLHKFDSLPSLIASRCFLAMGQLNEAQAECDRAVAVSPDDVAVTAIAASIALATGDLDSANQLIDQGDARLPAEPLLIVARAERAILSNDLTSLQTERDALVVALNGDKLLSLYSNLAKYDKLLGLDSPDDVWVQDAPD